MRRDRARETGGDLAAALLAAQPVPAGNRVGVVSNTRGGVVLAADACADAGLQIASLTGDTRRALRELLPGEAVVAGCPVRMRMASARRAELRLAR